MEKVCRKCGLSRATTLFSPDKRARDGLQGECQVCRRAHAKARYAADPVQWGAKARLWSDAHPDEVRARQKQYYEKNRERIKARVRAWQLAKIEQKREMDRAYRAAHPERIAANKRKWAKKNAEKLQALSSTRAALRRGAKGAATPADIAFLFARQRGMCAVCRERLPRPYHIDHIQPLARGGTNERGNLQLLCPRCNLSKGKTDPIVFMQRRGFLL